MVDFRYHLVSLVAVFIALAVGIALGAGPLREGISDTLEGEVSQLRAERSELRATLDTAEHRATSREESIGLLGPRAVAGNLTGVRVVVVVLPGADRNIVADLRDGLDQAGATVALTAELDSRWESPGAEDERQELVDELAPLLDPPSPRDGDSPTLATVLAATLLGVDAPGSTGAWLEVGATLDESGLVDLAWQDGPAAQVTDRRAPDAVLMVGGGLRTDDEQALDPATEQALESRLALVDALAQLEVPIAVVGVGTASGSDQQARTEDPLVLGIREDGGLAEAVSSVDDGESSNGKVAGVLALAWETQDEAGHYGLGGLAESPMPQPPPVRLTSGFPAGDDAETTEPVPEEEEEEGVFGDAEGTPGQTDPPGQEEEPAQGGEAPSDGDAADGDATGAGAAGNGTVGEDDASTTAAAP